MKKRNPTEHPSARNLREKIEHLEHLLKRKNDAIKDLEDEVDNLKEDLENYEPSDEETCNKEKIYEVIHEIDRLVYQLHHKTISIHKLQDKLTKWSNRLESAI